MKSQKNLAESIEDAIRDPSLQDTTSALAEIVIDGILEEGVLRDIPILGTAFGIARTVASVRDRLFLNKLRSLLFEIHEVPVSERQKVIQDLNSSAEETLRVGEKLLYIVDRCEDHEAAAMVGRLFRAYLEERLPYWEFLTYARIVDTLPQEEIIDFVNSDWDTIDAGNASPLLACGLVSLFPPSVSVSDQWDPDRAGQRYVVNSSELAVSVTPRGSKLRAVLATKTGDPNTSRQARTSPSPET